MSLVNSFALSLGVGLAFAAVMMAWVARTSGAPFVLKLLIPSILVIVACYTYLSVRAMMGYPTEAVPPNRARLIAFVAHDGPSHSDTVDLWLVSDGDTPRAYTQPMGEKLKQALQGAQEALRQGRPVMLVRQGGNGKKAVGAPGKGIAKDGTGTARMGDRNGIGHDDSGWDIEVANDMPPKDGR